MGMRRDEQPRETSGLSAGPMTPEEVDARWYLAVDEVSGWKVITGMGETIARGLPYRNATLIARTHNQAVADV
jgi:hypothetical protein